MADLLNTLPFLIKYIFTRLDQQDLTLLNISSRLSNNKSNYKYSTIPPTPPTSSIPLLPPPPPLHSFTSSFELRHLTNSKINWNKNPIYISNDTYNARSTSYNTYKLNIKSLNLSILSTISVPGTSIETTLSIPPFIHNTSKSQINAAILNVSIIRNKVDHTLDLFNDIHLDLICLTETWHKYNDVAISASLNINNLSFAQLNGLGPILVVVLASYISQILI